ncbi:Pleiotropic regulator 1 [Toxocara canis]|uniref:Pleiotropic regulator 1 n=1 Tax=Toxocara canis TaxID=6265 RepID=A0A0B2VD70_TOXCA|nr:Pleiotropic regulator 1 [Toxocara canis]
MVDVSATNNEASQQSQSESSTQQHHNAQHQNDVDTPQQKQLLNLVFRSMKRTHDFFFHDYAIPPEPDTKADELWRSTKVRSEYGSVLKQVQDAKRRREEELLNLPKNASNGIVLAPPVPVPSAAPLAIGDSSSAEGTTGSKDLSVVPSGGKAEDNAVRAMLPARAPVMVKPKWHAPWKLYRHVFLKVISGHTGWVRCVDVEPGNEWFATGGADRIVKIWDLATGKLRLSLTGHVSAVRACKVSHRHPFLFTGGEDKQVKCWDLEYNKVIRHYHGHLSAVQDLSIHPTLDILVTCARDATARVWDMRTKAQIHCFTGHTNTVASVVTQATDPQIITGSHDTTIRLWDLAAGRSIATLTHHKKSVRALTLHPSLYMFASGGADNIKQWKCPEGEFIQNLSGHNAIVNSLVCNEDGVLISGGDNGSMYFWDWKSGFCFQKEQSKAQPGSIDSEAGIFAMAFDQSGSRLITGEADKTIKMYREDETATEETHPVIWRPEILKRRAY